MSSRFLFFFISIVLLGVGGCSDFCETRHVPIACNPEGSMMVVEYAMDCEPLIRRTYGYRLVAGCDPYEISGEEYSFLGGESPAELRWKGNDTVVVEEEHKFFGFTRKTVVHVEEAGRWVLIEYPKEASR